MNSIFPATYSTLSPNALAILISTQYDLKQVECRFLLRGVGDTYLVETAKNRFILRAYNTLHRSHAVIKEEIDFLFALKAANVSVSYPITDISGEAIQSVNAIEGIRYLVLFSYAPGQSISTFNKAQLDNLGLQMAHLHNVSATVNLGKARWTFDLDTTLYKPVEILKPLLVDSPETYEWLLRSARMIRNKLAQFNTAGFSWGYCHYDMLPKNFHFHNDAVTFFDFDFIGYGWLVNDIMTFWQHLCLDVHFGRITQDVADKKYATFLNAYREVRPLSDEELAAIPYLALGFWLFYSAFHTTHDQFSLFIHPSQLKFRFGYVRQMIERYWEKEEISPL